MHALREPPLMTPGAIRPVRGWEDFLGDGQKYLQTARAAYAGRKSAFTPPILYNIIAMAVEKFAMAALMRRGTMPYHHAMAGLVAAMEEHFGEAIGDIREDLLSLDRYQEICDPDEWTVSPPDMTDIPGMLALAGRLRAVCEKSLAAQGDFFNRSA